jgi:hypothetical protein
MFIQHHEAVPQSCENLELTGIQIGRAARFELSNVAVNEEVIGAESL